VVRTGQYTGRSAEDKLVVREPESEGRIWWGKHNRPIEPERFAQLKMRLQAYLQGREVFVQDCYAGADPEYRLKVRVINENAWHNLFVRNMFLRERDRVVLARFEPECSIIQGPTFQAIPSSTAREASLRDAELRGAPMIIGGTSYAGEMKSRSSR
jgi:phosphoenolpyruvate carboxykinase (ATP)